MEPCDTVAYLCEFPTLLGGERSLLTFLTQRAAARVAPIVVAPREGPLAAALSHERIPFVSWPVRGRHGAAELAPELRDRGVKLVHANSLMTAGAAVALGDALGVPAVGHVRDIMTLSGAQVTALSSLAAVIAVSDAVAHRLVQQGVPADRIERIYNAVDPEALRRMAEPGALRCELSVGDGVLLIGCIGQIALRKGQDVFLDAAAIVAAEIPQAHFVIAGARYSEKAESRAFEAALHAKAGEPPLAGRTHLLGYREDVPSLLADLDVLVVPSRQEPLSRALLESLALGVPAVATDVGGTAEILADDSVGLLVGSGDPHAMAGAITMLLKDASLRARLRTNGPHCVAESFTLRRQVAALRRLYDRILVDG